MLALLAQLIQLRVNYCLLDSDQIFIGFIIKQFEFIEEGQIRCVKHVVCFLNPGEVELRELSDTVKEVSRKAVSELKCKNT